MTIRCEIVSQDRTVFQGDVDIVVLPGAAGEMGILPHHAPVLAILKYGVIKIRRDGKEDLFTVAGGVAEVQPDIVTILAMQLRIFKILILSGPKPPRSARRMRYRT